MTQELAMTKEQYNQVMNEIWKNHRFGHMSNAYWNDEEEAKKYKMIKYVRPQWDMRDGMCFSVTFEPIKMTFNSGYPATVPLFDQIMWLNSKRGDET